MKNDNSKPETPMQNWRVQAVAFLEHQHPLRGFGPRFGPKDIVLSKTRVSRGLLGRDEGDGFRMSENSFHWLLAVPTGSNDGKGRLRLVTFNTSENPKIAIRARIGAVDLGWQTPEPGKGELIWEVPAHAFGPEPLATVWFFPHESADRRSRPIPTQIRSIHLSR